VSPREPQQTRARGLGGLMAGVSLYSLGGERDGGQNRSFEIGVGDLAEHLVI